MSKPDFTPGPWFVGAQNDQLYVIDAPPSPAPYDGSVPKEYGPRVVAVPSWHLAEQAANARLIAAAPDMYEALRNIAALDYKNAAVNMAAAKAVEIAVAALAKATGGQP